MKAREGAALGIATMRLKDLSRTVADWISEEQEPSVRDALYEHMATNSQETPYFEQVVLEEYKKHGSGSVFRTKMLVSAAGTPLLNELRAVEVREGRREQELATGRQFDLFLGEPPTMTNNTFNFNGDVANFVAGNQQINTQAFEQTFSSSGCDTNALSDLVEHVKTEKGEEDGERLIEEINEVAKAKEPKAARSLKDRLNTLSDTTTAGTKAAIAIEKLKDVLDGWIA
jgi:superfamily I DNA/RNA helicase